METLNFSNERNQVQINDETMISAGERDRNENCNNFLQMKSSDFDEILSEFLIFFLFSSMSQFRREAKTINQVIKVENTKDNHQYKLKLRFDSVVFMMMILKIMTDINNKIIYHIGQFLTHQPVNN